MAIVLKVKPEELKKRANGIEKSIDSIENQLEEIGKVIIGTKKYWEGDASDAHRKCYSAFKDDIPKIIKKLKSHPVELLQMANLYDETERANEQLSSKLPNNVIE